MRQYATIYTAPTIEAAELALDRFDQVWAARYLPRPSRLGALTGTN